MFTAAVSEVVLEASKRFNLKGFKRSAVPVGDGSRYIAEFVGICGRSA